MEWSEHQGTCVCFQVTGSLVLEERASHPRIFPFLDASHCDFMGPVKEQSKNKNAGILACKSSSALVPVSSVVTGEDAPL